MHILVVDDHPIVRSGIVHLLRHLGDATSTSEADSVQGAVAQVAARRPDVIVLDLSLRRQSGLDVIRRLRDGGCTTPILVISVFDEVMHAEHVLRAGAQGYLMKESAPDLLLTAVQRVADGEVVLSSSMQAKVMASLVGVGASRVGPAALTAREHEILRLIGRGCTTSDIAMEMARSVKTVETHRSRIMRKLGLESAAQLVRYATLSLERGGDAERSWQ